jgi:hypothetical protein
MWQEDTRSTSLRSAESLMLGELPRRHARYGLRVMVEIDIATAPKLPYAQHGAIPRALRCHDYQALAYLSAMQARNSHADMLLHIGSHKGIRTRSNEFAVSERKCDTASSRSSTRSPGMRKSCKWRPREATTITARPTPKSSVECPLHDTRSECCRRDFNSRNVAFRRHDSHDQ